MDLNDLRIFKTVAEQGSLSQAARHLGYVQSNVTTRLRKLEDAVGQRLVDRQPRGVRLTAAGHLLLEYATQMLALWDKAQETLKTDLEPCGPLRLGTLESTAAARLPDVLLRFHRRWPAVTVHLQTGTTADLVTGVRQGNFDLALVAGPILQHEMNIVPVWEEHLVIVTATAEETPWLTPREDLGMLVFRTGCTYRAAFETWWIRHGMPRPRLLELGSIDALLHLASAGVGVALVPESVAAPSVLAGKLRTHPVDPDLATVTTHVVTRLDQTPSAATSAFLQHLDEERSMTP